MDITNDPLYKEVAAWKDKNQSLYDYINGLYVEVSFLREKRENTKNSEDVRAIDDQIMSLCKEIERSISTMEYGIAMTEVTNNG